MKLIQQSKLFFKEGNSDKVYEIDLCELSSSAYLVNFRYGRRGSSLKEGTKTPAAISHEQAIKIFNELDQEKRSKGYQTEIEIFIELPVLDSTIEPASAKGAILQRLQDAIEGRNSFKTEWKTSRVVWRAGTLQISESIPFIIKLGNKGDDMQLYASLWSLIRLGASQAIPLFQSVAGGGKQKAHIRNLAWEGLLLLSNEADRIAFSKALFNQLPEDIAHALTTGNEAQLGELLQKQPSDKDAGAFTLLYLLATVYPFIRKPLLAAIKSWPMVPPYFKQARAIYKLSQVRNDAATTALLSYAFEKAPAMFKRTILQDRSYKIYVNAINQSVHIGAELKSAESKLAFSHFTKTYFQKNAVQHLRNAGLNDHAAHYLQLAVATLLQYREEDYTPASEQPASPYGQYNYKTRQYHYTLHSYPECAGLLLLNTILFDKDSSRQLQPNLKFITGKREVTSRSHYYNTDSVSEITREQQSTQAPGESLTDKAINIFKGWFGKKKTEPAPAPQAEEQPATINHSSTAASKRTELYPGYWDEKPEAYVQLLMQAQMEIIHAFAYNNLKAHQAFGQILNRFDEQAILQLLESRFNHPQQLAAAILNSRLKEFEANSLFVAKVLNSNAASAREWAKSLIDQNQRSYFDNIEFALALLFNNREPNNEWINGLIARAYFTQERVEAIIGKAVIQLLQLEHSDEHNALAKKVIDRLQVIAGTKLEYISWDIIEQLVTSPLEANKILAGMIINRKLERNKNLEIPFSLVALFMESEDIQVRANGTKLLYQYTNQYIEQRLPEVVRLTDTAYEDVLTAALNRIKAVTALSSQAGIESLTQMVYSLIRKEKLEGAHVIISDFIHKELRPYWRNLKPKEVTRLIHAHYRPGQLTGYGILKDYPDANDFTLGQIISFGNHELLSVRQWCWNYFKQNIPRIRYERGKALSLLDADWDDTRSFAFHFFKTSFTEGDWDADTLIGIVDSIRPDVEQFGKEMIALHFKPEYAPVYLQKLSQHPGTNVQAFLTNYLSTYAGGKPDMLLQLSFYFRSVLTRVNKARVAKNRIFDFLRQEALRSVEAAEIITPIIDDVSAQSTIQDKATCIEILSAIKNKYPHLDMHLTLKSQAI